MRKAMINWFLAGIICIALSLNAFASETLPLNNTIDWENWILTVTGYGAPLDEGNVVVKKLSSQRAAISDAYRNALATIQGIRLCGETYVSTYTTKSDELRSKVEGLIQGGLFTSIEYDHDGGCRVTLSVPFGVGLANLFHNNSKSDPPPVKPTLSKADEFPEEYTGIIVDIRDFQVSEALLVQLFDEKGVLLFKSAHFTDPKTKQQGSNCIFVYPMDTAINKMKAGSKPLVLKPINVENETHNFILGQKDSEKFVKWYSNNRTIAIVFVIK